MLQPRDEADVADILGATACAVEPVAGGSKRVVGRPVAAETLDLAALRGIVDYEPDELVLTARAATPVEAIEAVLRECGQRLAFEPPAWTALLAPRASPDETAESPRAPFPGATRETSPSGAGRPTIGGVLAANASGSRRIAAGAARDHFLGFRAVSGRAERFKGGSRVVKNVTGYDLPKLLAGSWGTLAVLTEVTVRVHPLPERERTLVVALREPAPAVEAMSAALGSACEVSSAAFAPGSGAALRLEGFAPSVEARSAALLDVLPEACRRVDHHWLEADESRQFWRETGAAQALAAHPVVWRLSVAPSEAPRIVRQLEPRDYLLDWGGGLIWLGEPHADAERVRGALAGGHATLFKAPREVRAATPVFQPLSAPLAALTARLKAAFDPADRLNPGRMG